MKYYYITSDFIGGAIAYKLLKEGNEVVISQVQDLKELGNGDDEVDERVWLYDMKLKNGECLTAGCAWDLVVFTGGGATINSAVTRAYEAEDGFSFSNMIVRPRFDFKSTEYKSSIMNRYNQSKHLF